MIQRQTTFSLHNNSPSQRNCKLLCHNNWAIIPDSTTIERGRETDMKWTWLLSWKHLIDVHQNLDFKMEKNCWGARVTGNRCKLFWICSQIGEILMVWSFCFSGDPTVFGNLEPCHEMVDAVVKCIKQSKHNGYAPSTGTHRAILNVSVPRDFWERTSFYGIYILKLDNHVCGQNNQYYKHFHNFWDSTVIRLDHLLCYSTQSRWVPNIIWQHCNGYVLFCFWVRRFALLH